MSKRFQSSDIQSQKHVTIKPSCYEKQSTRHTISSNQEYQKQAAQKEFQKELQYLKKKLKSKINFKRNVALDSGIPTSRQSLISTAINFSRNQFENNNNVSIQQSGEKEPQNFVSIRRKSCHCQKCGNLTKFEFKANQAPQFIKMKEKLLKQKKRALNDIFEQNSVRPKKIEIEKRKTQYQKKKYSQDFIESPQTFKHSYRQQPNSPNGQLSPIDSSNFIIIEEEGINNNKISKNDSPLLNQKFQKYAYGGQQLSTEELGMILTTRNKRSQTLSIKSRKNFSLVMNSLEQNEQNQQQQQQQQQQILQQQQQQQIIEKIEELKIEEIKEAKLAKKNNSLHFPKIHELLQANQIKSKNSKQWYHQNHQTQKNINDLFYQKYQIQMNRLLTKKVNGGIPNYVENANKNISHLNSSKSSSDCLKKKLHFLQQVPPMINDIILKRNIFPDRQIANENHNSFTHREKENQQHYIKKSSSSVQKQMLQKYDSSLSSLKNTFVSKKITLKYNN